MWEVLEIGALKPAFFFGHCSDGVPFRGPQFVETLYFFRSFQIYWGVLTIRDPWKNRVELHFPEENSHMFHS